MSVERDEGFLGRWSRLKREGEPAPVAGTVEVVPEETPRQAPEKTDAEILEELGLPDPAELKAGDDFSAFMARAVPEHLRRRALRRLWLSDPALANLDELVDYGQDFTDAALAVTNIQTGFQLGRGFSPDPEELAARKAAADAEAEARADAEARAAATREADTGENATREDGAELAEEPSATEAGDGGPEAASRSLASASRPVATARPRIRFVSIVPE